MLYGLGILLTIAIMGGAIAYIGDRLGTKIGKRKMTVFGLRPKYTSILITICTGILIAALTLGILTALSENVRTALFGMEKLQAEMNYLSGEVQKRTQDLEKAQKALQDKNTEISAINTEIVATKEELEEARAAREAMHGELVNIRSAYADSEAKLAASAKDVAELEKTKGEMERHITDLQVTAKSLEEGIIHLREGNVLFRVGEVLAGATVRPGLTKDDSYYVVLSIVNDTNGLILRRLGITDAQDKTILYVSRENLNQVVAQLAEAKEPMTVRITAAANIIYGEMALANIQVYPYRLIYHKGDVIYSQSYTGPLSGQDEIIALLEAVNKTAKEKGVLPDPISGNVGSLPGEDLFAAIREVQQMGGPITIEAIAVEDCFSDGPVKIRLRISER